ncbi:MAG: DUF2784 domain-containing protein [Thermodesulfovibrionia bacterium]|nr:DUF2784 domain-containing protein [Thermodesulfovibrionia bacterium]
MTISNVYTITADIVVLLHFLWIMFLIFGALIGRRYTRVKVFHIAGMGFAVIIQIFGWYCPLTYIEVWLRKMHQPSQGYEGSFIINYVEKIVYLEFSGKIILIATIFLVLISTLIYLHNPKKNLNKKEEK